MAGTPKSLYLEPQAGSHSDSFFENSKPGSNGIPPSTRPHHLILPNHPSTEDQVYKYMSIETILVQTTTDAYEGLVILG